VCCGGVHVDERSVVSLLIICIANCVVGCLFVIRIYQLLQSTEWAKRTVLKFVTPVYADRRAFCISNCLVLWSKTGVLHVITFKYSLLKFSDSVLY